MRRGLSLVYSLLVVLTSLSILVVPAAQAQSGQHVLITQSVDESKLVTLAGNTRPEAVAKNDRGLAPSSLALNHMLLQLKRSPEQERELEQYIEQLTDKSSPNFHQWLSAKEFGERYGVSQQDRDAIKGWLQSHGLKVNVEYTNGTLLDFSGTAGQVREAFHTEIHELQVKGEKHFANMSDPRIPAALAPAIVGVVSMHDFKPHANFKPRSNYTASLSGQTYYLVGPGDLAKIYNLNPLFSSSVSGQGQTIVVVEDTNVYTTADWNTFRSVFGLSSYTGGSFTQIHPAPPTGSNNCSNPGVNGDDIEAILDAEYASASAPSAAIQLASCADTATFGGLIAIQNLLNESSTPPAIISMSYGECEAFNGASSNAAFNSAFQQAATAGVSVFVSSGDDAASGCDRDATSATHGVGVTGWGSSPYVVSVGGTDFGDSFAGDNSTYWSATNSSTYESALSYINEIPWNDSCASVLITETLGFSEPYGSSGFCNSSAASADGLLNTTGGSGGPSACATGAPSVSGVVSGSCVGPNHRGRSWWAIQPMACATFPMSRCLPPTAFGDIFIPSAIAILRTAALPARERR
jgi:subtilase family serine protease